MAQIIDDGDAGYSTSGTWTYVSGFGGYNNDYDYSAKGTGSDTATWTFSTPPGVYLVAATWTIHENRATDAPFTIKDGSTVLETVDVDQEVAPSDFADGGVNWHILGTYSITSGSLVVVLSDDADDFVIADAIWIEEQSTPQIIDDDDDGYSYTGSPNTASGLGGYNDDYDYAKVATEGNVTFYWTFSITPGKYVVAATWTIHENRATDAPYSIYNGESLLETVDVDQEVAPSDFADDGVNWDVLGTYDITATTLKVSLTDVDADEYVIADAVWICRVGNLDVAATLGAVAAAGYDATITARVECGLGQVDVAGYGAAITSTARVECGLGQVDVAGYDATITARVECGLGWLDVAGYDATITARVECGFGQVDVAGYGAAITFGQVDVAGYNPLVTWETAAARPKIGAGLASGRGLIGSLIG